MISLRRFYVFEFDVAFYAKARSTGGGRVKREKTKNRWARIGCRAGDIQAATNAVRGRGCGTDG
jgi:hypothetical protein